MRAINQERTQTRIPKDTIEDPVEVQVRSGVGSNLVKVTSVESTSD
jgi:hypothetical protein